MTVLIVLPWPLRSPGGGQRLARDIGVALATHHGWNVHIAAGAGLPGSPPVPVEDSATIQETRIPTALLGQSSWWRRSTDFAWDTHLPGLESMAGDVRPDVVMFAAHYSAAAEQTAAVAARLRVPFVLLPAIHLDHRRHVDRRARRFYQSADLVVCQSAAERWWLRRRAGLPGDRVLWLRCGWDGAAVRRTPTRARDVRLLTVSAFSGHKQVDHQLRAMAHVRKAHGLRTRLVVAGALADPTILEALRRLARSLNIEGDVEFRPDCTDAELRQCHRDSDYFLFTSRSESFGLAVLDAIGAGLVPVVYPHSTYGRLVRSSRSGVIATRATPAALADALALAERGLVPADDRVRKTWLDRRSWSRVSAALADALRRVTVSPARVRA
jgi:glycosyltransferase involved in cell wall biosynthesis